MIKNNEDIARNENANKLFENIAEDVCKEFENDNQNVYADNNDDELTLYTISFLAEVEVEIEAKSKEEAIEIAEKIRNQKCEYYNVEVPYLYLSGTNAIWHHDVKVN